jgi:hypothetical protein
MIKTFSSCATKRGPKEKKKPSLPIRVFFQGQVLQLGEKKK